MMRLFVLCLGFFITLTCVLPVPEVAAQQAEETVCIQCHAGQEGSLGAPVQAWRGSVHDRNGISCHDCHGGDPTDFAMAMSPERGFVGVPEHAEIPQFCGKCHVGVLEDYQKSAHGQALEAGGAQCVTCHSSHAVEVAKLDLINRDSCTRCHDYGRAEKIKEILADTDARIKSLEGELERLSELGTNVDEQQGQLFSLRNRFHRAFHTVKIERIREQTGPVLEGLDKLREEIAAIESDLGQRKFWGSVAIALLVVAGILFFLIRRTYEDEEKL